MDEADKEAINRRVALVFRDYFKALLADDRCTDEKRAWAADRLRNSEEMLAKCGPAPVFREKPWHLRAKRTRADFDPNANYGRV